MDLELNTLVTRAKHACSIVLLLESHSKRMCEALYRLCQKEQWRLADFSKSCNQHRVLTLQYEISDYLQMHNRSLRNVHALQLKAVKEAKREIINRAKEQIREIKLFKKTCRDMQRSEEFLSLYQNKGSALDELLFSLLRTTVRGLSEQLPCTSQRLPPELDEKIRVFVDERVRPLQSVQLPDYHLPEEPSPVNFATLRL